MSRGNRGEKVFRGDRERTLWLETLGEAVEKTGWRIHAYVLMGRRARESGHCVAAPATHRSGEPVDRPAVVHGGGRLRVVAGEEGKGE